MMASPDITGAGEQTAAEVGDANGRVNHAAKSVETEETETAKFENIPVTEPEQKATDEDTVGQHVILSPKGRIQPGTKTEDLILDFPLDLSESDSWFQQEDQLNQLLNTIDPASLTVTEARLIAATPPNMDPNLWIYEWLRRLTRDLNFLVVAMLQDGCSPTACPEMRSVDCQYLCATHDKPRECPATDYIVHTLDYTIALLNSSKLFPSRIMIQDGPMQYLHSSARRLYRIFIHAYEHHNDTFRTFENETGMYTLFLALTEQHNLVPKDLITIPSDYKATTEDQDTEGGYFTIPALDTIKGHPTIPNLILGRRGYGYIRFHHPVDLTTITSPSDLREILSIDRGTISLYGDGAIPPEGQGLNVPATVTLEKVFPDAGVGTVEFVEELERSVDTEFVSWDRESGCWTFNVQHFSSFSAFEGKR